MLSCRKFHCVSAQSLAVACSMANGEPDVNPAESSADAAVDEPDALTCPISLMLSAARLFVGNSIDLLRAL